MFAFLGIAKKDYPPLYFHNTLSGTKELFKPLTPGLVRLYNCGPTVYDFQHIGNMRSAVFANTVRRTLEWNGYDVRQVINITDVGHLLGDNQGDASVGEDRMEVGAERRGLSVKDVATEVTEAYFADLDLLNIDRAKITFPRATEYIPEQIALIKTLEEKGYTYRTPDGIYFDTARFKDYGKLGNIHLAGLKEGARLGEVEGRKNLSDFALWKFSPLSESGKKRQQEWPSPWGVGFPGWHIECTAMIFALLGRQIDIHTGGIEHIPIHHNNEIAQAESVTDKPYATYWLHNEWLQIEGKKISKSVGNTVYVRNLVDRGFSPLALRYLFLTTHYRSPMNFTWESIRGAQTALSRVQKYFVDELRGHKHGAPDEKFLRRFREAVNDDLNTAQGMAIMWDVVKDAFMTKEDKRATLLQFDRVLGLGFNNLAKMPDTMIKIRHVEVDELPQEAKQILSEREQARAEKRWLDADLLRADLLGMGYAVEDTAEGPRIEKRDL